MGKAVAGAGLATAAVLYGGYGATEVFVPPRRGATSLGHAFRGSDVASGVARSVDFGASLLRPATALAGVLAAVRVARPSRVCRLVATLDSAAAGNEAPLPGAFNPADQLGVTAPDSAAAGNEAPPPGVFNPADQLGVTAPLGYFDPLGLCLEGEQETFRLMRIAELKHGRVAMLASVGLLAQHYIQFPGLEMAPKGIAGAMNNPNGSLALLLLSGVVEVINFTADWQSGESSPVSEIGNYGNPGRIYPKNMESMKNRELNNGRLAMITAIGIIAAELATGKDAAQQLGWA